MILDESFWDIVVFKDYDNLIRPVFIIKTKIFKN